MTAGRTLLLMRHAAAAAEVGRPDHDRQLTTRGRHACHLVGAALLCRGVRPDLVLCSSALRTRQTVEGLGEAVPAGTQVDVSDALYLADEDTLLTHIQESPATAGTVLVVAHNPGIHALALLLLGADGRTHLPTFPTATLAALTVGGPWSDLGPGGGTLRTDATLRTGDLSRS